jgi:hypothetical protein
MIWRIEPNAAAHELFFGHVETMHPLGPMSEVNQGFHCPLRSHLGSDRSPEIYERCLAAVLDGLAAVLDGGGIREASTGCQTLPSVTREPHSSAEELPDLLKEAFAQGSSLPILQLVELL